MRYITLLGTLALTSGCAAIDSDLQYQGVLETPTNGVVLFEDGQTGHAAMQDQTCAVTINGQVQDDVDLVEGAGEEVLDGSSGPDGSVTLARTRGQIHLIEQGAQLDDFGFNMSDATVHSITAEGVTDAAFTADGIAALSDCSLAWMDKQGEVMDIQLLDIAGCTGMEPTFGVHRVTGTAFVQSDNGIFAVTQGGVTDLGLAADLYTVSQQMEGLALSNGSELSFAGFDGQVQWATPLRGNITSMADLGARGWVAAMVDNVVDGNVIGGRLEIVDGTTGAIVKGFDLPSTADVVASADGSTLALVTANKVFYYTLR